MRAFDIKLDKVWCDLDGVLFDFDKGYETQTDISISIARNMPKDIFWGNIQHIPHFFYDLPLMEDAEELWSEILFLNPSILTAIPRISTYANAGPDKIRSVAKHFGENIEVVLVQSASNKVKHYRPGTRDVLIDDRPDTILSWQKVGGIGIYHTSAFDSICQLREHGII